MRIGLPSKLPADLIVDPRSSGRIHRSRQLRSVGWLGVLLSLAALAAKEAASVADARTYAFVGVGVTVSLLLINWARLWVQESRDPFQYTYSVEEFSGSPDDVRSSGAEASLAWLRRDLVEKLGTRVSRLSLLEEALVPDLDEESPPAAHVHVCGWYSVREGNDGGSVLEVVPHVRLGGSKAPGKVAQTVRYRLPPQLEEGALLSSEDYRRLFERIYWSVASQIYAQIREGVEEKVRLLPPGRLRAAAFLAEADDYATSNTLDAYGAARSLYRRAQEIYDVASRGESATRWRRFASRTWIGADRLRCRVRRFAAGFLRVLGRREVLAARAELGYAWMLAAEYHLRLLSGTVPHGIYEAAPNIEAAMRRLEKTPNDVEGRQDILFRAKVTLATARFYLGDGAGARAALCEAEALRPARTRDDPEFLLAAGLAEVEPVHSLRLMARAAELAPAMERAHFQRAQMYEELWRRRNPLEPDVARLVLDEYAKVIAVNPGNLAAWANRGFIAWLLADPGSALPQDDGGEEESTWRDIAVASLEAGREYKEVRGEAMVAELDWNLARITAEEGKFARAYAHYVNAISAMLGEPRLGFVEYFFERPTPALMERFIAYLKRVEKNARISDGEPRLVRSVLAFARTDCGLAHYSSYLRGGQPRELTRARECFEKAETENPDFVLPAFHLAKLDREAALGPVSLLDKHRYLTRAAGRLRQVLSKEPGWALAQIEMLDVQIDLLEWAQSVRRAIPAPLIRTSARTVPPPLALDAEPFDSLSARAEVDRISLGSPRIIDSLLSTLLPHPSLRPKGQPTRQLDATGVDVDALIKSQRSRWTHDYNAIQVQALIRWSRLLTLTSPAAARKLCEELRRVHSPADLNLLKQQKGATMKMVSSDHANEADAGREMVERCDELMKGIVRERLGVDPAHDLFLRDASLLSTEDRLLAFDEGIHHALSVTTLTWIAGERFDLGDRRGSIQACTRALEAGGADGEPKDWRQVGHLCLRLEETDLALEAYRRAAKAGDRTVSPAAAAEAARILRGRGEDGAAEAEFERTARNPAVAPEIALMCESEGRTTAARSMLEKVLTQKGVSSDQRARARFELAGLLIRQDQTNAAETHLRTLVRKQSDSRHLALLLLAGKLARTDPTEARTFYEAVLDEGVPDTSLAATRELLQIAEESSQKEICARAGAIDPLVALHLGDELLSRGQDDLAETAYRAASAPGQPIRSYTGDVRLRLGDLYRTRGEVDNAITCYKLAVDSGNLRVVPDAVIAAADLMAEAQREEKEKEEDIKTFYASVVSWAASAVEAAPGFALALYRELEARLEALGQPGRVGDLREAVVAYSRDLAAPLAASLEQQGEEAGAVAIRSLLARA